MRDVPPRAASPRPARDLSPGLYVHVPFCEARCSYCDFYAVARGQAGGHRFADALEAEARLRTPAGFAPRTVFIGGGTPSALEDDDFQRMLELIRRIAPEATRREWTVENNPGSLTPAKAAAMRAAGVNRVSIGVQSFDDAILRSVGRIHDAETARDAVRIARDAGIEQVSIDLLFAIPGQGIETFRADLREAVRLETDHVSAYALIYEHGTPLTRHVAAGRVTAEAEDTELEMLRLAHAELGEAGFVRYEVSNFARPGAECLHNLNYWRNGEYLGLGPAAASYLDGERRRNVASWQQWQVAALDGRELVESAERLTGAQGAGEELMLRLRLTEGASLHEISTRWGLDVDRELAPLWTRFEAASLVKRDADGDRIRLTERGREVADGILAEVLAAL